MSAGASLGSKTVDSSPGAPDPLEGRDPRPGEEDPSTADGNPEEEGPFFAWLPPEDRLWRHPSEGAPAPDSSGSALAGGYRRWGAVLPRSLLRSTWAVALIAGLVGATAATGIGLASGLWPRQTTVLRSVVPSTSSVSLADVGAEPTDWAAVDDSVAASVVTVSVNGSAGPQVGSGLVFLQAPGGTAFVVTDRSLFSRDQEMGYIGAINVTFLSGATSRAKLIGDDPLSGLAVLEISDRGQAVPAAALGTISNLREADQVLVVGSRAAPSVSPGSISAEDRTVSLSDGTDLDGLLAVSMPPLNPTAAGAPLLNQFGQVVGLTLNLQPVDQADQQFSFAVPIDEVARVATQIIDGTAPTHPWIGVSDAESVPSAVAHQLGIDGGVQAGTVSPGSPASKAGLRANDVITSFAGKPVVSVGALVAQINGCTPGQAVPVTYVHGGRTVHTKVEVANEPRDS